VQLVAAANPSDEEENHEQSDHIQDDGDDYGH